MATFEQADEKFNSPKKVETINYIEKFLSKIDIDITSECWNWTGNVSKHGYGILKNFNRQVRAHRMSFSIFKGDLDLSKVIDHICKNRKCVNPDHLREVTGRENTLKNSNAVGAINKNKTHCSKGHELIESNIKIRKTGRKECLTCVKIFEKIAAKRISLKRKLKKENKNGQ